MYIQVQKAIRTPNAYDQKRTSPCHIIVKILKKKILKAARDKWQIAKANSSELLQTSWPKP
jgi:hypothetical protein